MEYFIQRITLTLTRDKSLGYYHSTLLDKRDVEFLESLPKTVIYDDEADVGAKSAPLCFKARNHKITHLRMRDVGGSPSLAKLHLLDGLEVLDFEGTCMKSWPTGMEKLESLQKLILGPVPVLLPKELLELKKLRIIQFDLRLGLENEAALNDPVVLELKERGVEIRKG